MINHALCTHFFKCTLHTSPLTLTSRRSQVTKKNGDGRIYYLNSHEAELSKSEYHGEKTAGYIKIFEDTWRKGGYVNCEIYHPQNRGVFHIPNSIGHISSCAR